MRYPLALALPAMLLVGACADESALAPVEQPSFRHGDAQSYTLEYLKVETGRATAQWTGRVWGGITGGLETQVTSVNVVGDIWHLETLWEVFADEQSFTAELDGILNVSTGELRLRGRVLDGFLEGAVVENRGALTGIDPVTGATIFEGSLSLVHHALR